MWQGQLCQGWVRQYDLLLRLRHPRLEWLDRGAWVLYTLSKFPVDL